MATELYEMDLRVQANGDSAEHVRNRLMDQIRNACGDEWFPDEWLEVDMAPAQIEGNTVIEWKAKGRCRIARYEGRHG